jgi:tetratricopeptide (TPR) repeat protein
MSDDSDSRSQGLLFALAAIVVLLLCGGAAFWWQARQAATLRAEREAAVTEMEAARAEADARRAAEAEAQRAATEQLRQVRQVQERLAREGRAGVERTLDMVKELRQGFRFKEAAALLESIEPLLNANDDLKPKVQRAKEDLAVLAQLDAIRMRKYVWVTVPGGRGRFDTASAAPAYRAAFRAYGLDLIDGDPEDLAGRIKASAVRAELIAALDDLAALPLDEPTRDRVLSVLRRADPGPWLDRFRDPAVRGDKLKLAELARAADPAALSPASAVALAELMQRLGLDPSPLLLASQRQHPGDFGLNFALGQRFVGSSPDQAVAHYRAAVAVQPGNAAAWNNLGVTLLQKGDTDAAIAAFREAIRLDPADPKAHYHYGVILLRMGDLAGATAAFRQAIRLDPNFAAAYRGLADTARANGAVDDAIAAYREAIRLDPKDAASHAGLGTGLRDKGDYDGAIAAFREAIRLDPKRYESLLKPPAVAPPPRPAKP